MKLSKLKEQVLLIKTPNGNTVPIGFMEFVAHCYADSVERKNRLPLDKYLLIKKQALEEGWEDLVRETEAQAQHNQRMHRKAYLAAKYAVKRSWFRFKRLLTRK